MNWEPTPGEMGAGAAKVQTKKQICIEYGWVYNSKKEKRMIELEKKR